MATYITATYDTKYYAETVNYRGLRIRLEVQQRRDSGSAPVTRKMGDFCGCQLEVQGSQSDPYAPIVKTQLRFSVVDSSDKTSTPSVKYGNWSEFFTPDSTKYLVVLKTRQNDTDSWSVRWKGYITPDSWQESLEYRGVITITARDNIGHLQDFEFDMIGDDYGLASTADLVEQAFTKIAFPMNMVSELSKVDSGQDSATNLYFCVDYFKGKDWYHVLESVIGSLGFALRYTDYGSFYLSPIKDIPLFGWRDKQELPQINPMEFYGAATRTLSPGCKKIIDTMEYGYEGDLDLDVMEGINYGTATAERFKFQGSVIFHRGPVFNNLGNGDYGWQSGRYLLDPTGVVITKKLLDAEGDNIKKAPIIAVSTADITPVAVYKFKVFSANLNIRMLFGTAIEVKEISGSQSVPAKIGILKDAIKKLKLVILYESGGSSYWWTGTEWSTSLTYVDLDMSGSAVGSFLIEQKLTEPDGANGGVLSVGIDCAATTMDGSDDPEYGLYIRLAELIVTANAKPLQSDTVTTINNDSYNVTIKRNPELGALSQVVSYIRPYNYKRAFYVYTSAKVYQASYKFSFREDGTEFPLPVLVHKQILTFYHTPMEILHGDCAPSEKGRFRFDTVLSYKGKQFILQSGTWDLLTGVIQGATLREFIWYDDLWSD